MCLARPWPGNTFLEMIIALVIYLIPLLIYFMNLFVESFPGLAFAFALALFGALAVWTDVSLSAHGRCVQFCNNSGQTHYVANWPEMGEPMCGQNPRASLSNTTKFVFRSRSNTFE